MSLFSFSKKTDYGFLFLSKLAKDQELKSSVKTSLTSFAKENNLPVKFMEQIANCLKEADILSSREGRSGGYILAKSSNNINLYDVLSALEGKIAHTKCMNDNMVCEYEHNCGMKNIWKGVGNEIENILKNKTLADITLKRT